MTDLLTPEEVGHWLKGPLGIITAEVSVARLCRDYLTLWDELQAKRDLSDKLSKENGVLKKQLTWFDNQLRLQELYTRPKHPVIHD